VLIAFFETFVTTLLIFAFIEFLLRILGVGKHIEEFQEQTIADQLKGAIVLCKVEKISDVFYFYNSQDDNFVGQACTLNDITEISERLQKNIMIVDGDKPVLDQLKELTNEISISK
jgi:hypothetical protein